MRKDIQQLLDEAEKIKNEIDRVLLKDKENIVPANQNLFPKSCLPDVPLNENTSHQPLLPDVSDVLVTKSTVAKLVKHRVPNPVTGVKEEQPAGVWRDQRVKEGVRHTNVAFQQHLNASDVSEISEEQTLNELRAMLVSMGIK